MRNYEANVKKILETLLDSPQYLTLAFVAQKAGISKRSVQNYLTDIDVWIQKNGLLHTQIIRKQGQGIRISADAIDRMKIETLLSGKSLSIYSDDNNRRLDMIKKMIILEEDITIKLLSEQFHVSRSTIICDMEWIKEWLSPYKIELFITQRKGVVMRGSEASYRNAITGYFDSRRLVETGEALVLRKRGRFKDNQFENLIKIYSEDTIAKVKKIIEDSEAKFDFFLTDDYFTSLLTHIVISISRFISGNTVPLEFTPPDDEEFPVFALETAAHIAKRLETVFNVKVSDMERTYICIHLVGFNALSAEQSASAEMPREIKHLAMELIKTVDQRLGTRFISDKLLFFGLCMHLKAKVFRLKRGVYHREPSWLFQLPDIHCNTYNAVVASSGLYKEICGVEPDQDELLSITCYLLLSQGRNQRRFKALLVCNDGVIERMELMESIEKELPMVDIADCCTTYQLKLMTADEYDFIISMEAMEPLERPVADLSKRDGVDYTQFILEFIQKIDL